MEAGVMLRFLLKQIGELLSFAGCLVGMAVTIFSIAMGAFIVMGILSDIESGRLHPMLPITTLGTLIILGLIFIYGEYQDYKTKNNDS